MTEISLSSGLGEEMSPGILVTCLILSPDGRITLDPGALHGRSRLEQPVQWAARREELADPQCYRFIWVAMELDHAQQPFRYKGLAVSDVWLDAQGRGFKAMADSVNRISDALMGRADAKTLSGKERRALEQHLKTISENLWDRAAEPVKRALL
ncbi:MAG: hypothetical protein COV75_00425 [Candidatus Omnitrophica bacterium CG11_big_fil_rev_8_21_14_0_20_63_9]|nr:MAG: hypothetical protein COV75_00425 [Candidatus Omnitrophica bacterium CG11_big_fil_rev_8_21_14_0_20_63_9]